MNISRVEGIILVIFMIIFLGYLVKRALKNPDSEIADIPKEISKPKSFLFLLIGLVGIILGGQLLTDSASKIAISLGMSEMLVGLTIVAFGTSLPELVTSGVAAFKKQGSIALGNIIGSNIFNIFFVLGLSSTIRPITMIGDVIYDLLLLLGISIVVLIFAITNKKFSRAEGITLLLVYGIYLTYIIIRN